MFLKLNVALHVSVLYVYHNAFFFRHELYHVCGHLLDYITFLKRNCETSIMWKDNFVRTLNRELKMLTVLTEKSEKSDTKFRTFVQDLYNRHDGFKQSVENQARQVSPL